MLQKFNLKKIIVVINASIAVSACIIGLRHQGSFEQIELLAYDALIRLNAQSDTDPRITIININNHSLQQLNKAQISDRTLKEVLEKIIPYQPRVIGVDIVRHIPIGEGRKELIDYVNNIYYPLEKAIKPIIFPCALPSENKPQGIAPPPVIDPDTAIGFIDLETDPQDIFGRKLIRRAVISSIPANFDSETISGTQFDAKSGNYLCTAPFSFAFLTALSYVQGEEITPKIITTDHASSVPLSPSASQSYLATIKKNQITNLPPDSTPDITKFLDLTKISEGEIKFQSLILRPLKPKTGAYRNLDPTAYQFLIDYHYTQPGEIIPFTKILENQVTPEQFTDKVVLIGYTTKNHIQQTPFGSSSGVFVHGWMISQLLRNALDRQPQIWTWSEVVEWSWILGWGIVGSIVALRIHPVGIYILSQSIAIAILWGSCWLLFTQKGWIPLIPPSLSFAISGVLVKTINSIPRLSDRSIIDEDAPTITHPSDLIEVSKPDEEAEDFFIGKSIGKDGRYLLKKLLGVGGMSKVYLALDKNLKHKEVAIKIMNNYFVTNYQDSIKRFMGEIEKLCILNHPNIIQIKEQGLTPNAYPFYGYPFYVMEYCIGQTLQELLNETGKLAPNVAFKIILKVCRGLKEAHQQGIIHRDIKPGNIFVSAGDVLGEVVKIIDFGIAKKITEEAKQYNQLTIGFIGTYRYASPEQIEGTNIDSRTDIYSLGVVFYEILTGNHPYNMTNNSESLEENPQPLREQPDCQNLSPELEAIVMKCLSKSPQNRFQTIEQLEQALRELW